MRGNLIEQHRYICDRFVAALIGFTALFGKTAHDWRLAPLDSKSVIGETRRMRTSNSK